MDHEFVIGSLNDSSTRSTCLQPSLPRECQSAVNADIATRLYNAVRPVVRIYRVQSGTGEAEFQ